MDYNSSHSDGARVSSNNRWIRQCKKWAFYLQKNVWRKYNEMANDDDREADSSKAPVPDSNNAFSDTSKGGQKLPRSLFPS